MELSVFCHFIRSSESLTIPLVGWLATAEFKDEATDPNQGLDTFTDHARSCANQQERCAHYQRGQNHGGTHAYKPRHKRSISRLKAALGDSQPSLIESQCIWVWFQLGPPKVGLLMFKTISRSPPPVKLQNTVDTILHMIKTIIILHNNIPFNLRQTNETSTISTTQPYNTYRIL